MEQMVPQFSITYATGKSVCAVATYMLHIIRPGFPLSYLEI